jgi:hypothetical protein
MLHLLLLSSTARAPLCTLSQAHCSISPTAAALLKHYKVMAVWARSLQPGVHVRFFPPPSWQCTIHATMMIPVGLCCAGPGCLHRRPHCHTSATGAHRATVRSVQLHDSRPINQQPHNRWCPGATPSVWAQSSGFPPTHPPTHL